MADQILNVGNQGDARKSIASEATLLELLAAFKDNAGLSEKQIKALKELGGNYKPEKDKKPGLISKGFGKVTDAADALDKSLRGLPRQFQNFDDFLTKGTHKPIQELGGSIQKVTSGFESIASNKWIKWAGGGLLAVGFATLGTTVGVLTGYLQNSIDSFKELSSVGGNFGGDLLRLRNAALMGNLSLDEFAKLVSQNSELFSALGGNVSIGAERFAKLSKDVRNFDDQRLKKLGYTVEGTNEFLIDYMTILGKTGNVQELLVNNQDRVVAGAVKFGTELNELSAITGLNRKQLSKEVKDQASRGEVQARLLLLENQGIKNVTEKFNNLIVATAPFGKTITKAAGDLFAFSGAFRTQESRELAIAAGPFARTLVNLTAKIRDNAPDVEVKEAYAQNVEALMASEKQLIQMASMGNKAAIKILEETEVRRNRYRGKFGADLRKLIEQDRQDDKNKQKLGNSLLKLEEIFRSVQSKITAVFVNSKTFEKITSYLDQFANFLASAEFDTYLQKFLNSLEKAVDYVGNIFTDEGRQYILRDISNLWSTALLWLRETFISSSWYRWLTGDSKEAIQVEKDNLEAQKKLNSATGDEIAALREKERLDARLAAAKTDREKQEIAGLQLLNDIKLQTAQRDKVAAAAQAKLTEEQMKAAGLSTLQTDVNKHFDDFIKLMQKASTTLFTEEGRQKLVEHVVDVFDSIFLGLRKVVAAFRDAFSWLPGVTKDKELPLAELAEAYKKEARAIAPGIKTKQEQLADLDTQLSRENILPEEAENLLLRRNVIQSELDLLQQQKAELEARRKVLTEGTDAQKEILLQSVKEYTAMKAKADAGRSAYEALFRQFGIGDLSKIDQYVSGELKITAAEKANIKARLEAEGKPGGDAGLILRTMNQEARASENKVTLDDLRKAETKLESSFNRSMGENIGGLPQREDGGPTGKGGLFRLHANEFVLSKPMIEDFNELFKNLPSSNMSYDNFSASKFLNLSTDQPDRILNDNIDIILENFEKLGKTVDINSTFINNNTQAMTELNRILGANPDPTYMNNFVDSLEKATTNIKTFTEQFTEGFSELISKSLNDLRNIFNLDTFNPENFDVPNRNVIDRTELELLKEQEVRNQENLSSALKELVDSRKSITSGEIAQPSEMVERRAPGEAPKIDMRTLNEFSLPEKGQFEDIHKTREILEDIKYALTDVILTTMKTNNESTDLLQRDMARLLDLVEKNT